MIYHKGNNVEAIQKKPLNPDKVQIQKIPEKELFTNQEGQPQEKPFSQQKKPITET